MYNGIGLTTPRGSGTNGHVQRNFAFVRPGKKDNVTYKTESDLAKLDAVSNRPPNRELLDHERKRKVEVKCAELEEILEKQGYTAEEIATKVESYRCKLTEQKKEGIAKDEFGRVQVRDTHQIAEAQQEKNARLRDAFGISDYFVEGSSFDPDRKAKEDVAKSAALQQELQLQKEAEKDRAKKYAPVRTPSHERGDNQSDQRDSSPESKSAGKTTKESTNEESRKSKKKLKKKKSKKNKKESKSKKKKSRKHDYSSSDDSDSSDDDRSSRKRVKTKHKKDQKKRNRSPSQQRSSSAAMRLTDNKKKPRQEDEQDDHKRKDTGRPQRDKSADNRRRSRSVSRSQDLGRLRNRLNKENKKERSPSDSRSRNRTPLNNNKSKDIGKYRSENRTPSKTNRSKYQSESHSPSPRNRRRSYSRKRLGERKSSSPRSNSRKGLGDRKSRSPRSNTRKGIEDGKSPSPRSNSRKGLKDRKSPSTRSNSRKGWGDRKSRSPRSNSRKGIEDKKSPSPRSNTRKCFGDRKSPSPRSNTRKGFGDRKSRSPRSNTRKGIDDRKSPSPRPNSRKCLKDRKSPSPRSNSRKGLGDRKSRSPGRNQPAKETRGSPPRKDRKRSASTSSSSVKRMRRDDSQIDENRNRMSYDNRDGGRYRRDDRGARDSRYDRDGGRNNREDYGLSRRVPEVKRNTDSKRTPDRKNEAGPSRRDAQFINKQRSRTPDNRQKNVNERIERSRSRHRSTSRGRPSFYDKKTQSNDEVLQKPNSSSARVENRPQRNISHSPVHKPKPETNSTKTENRQQNEGNASGANPFRKKPTQKEPESRSHTPPSANLRDEISSSKSSSLSYSPARRSPDRYKDITDKNTSSHRDGKSGDNRAKVSRTPSPTNQYKKDQRKLSDRSEIRDNYSQKERNVHPTPVVRLRASSESETEIEKNDPKADETVAAERNDESQKDKRLLDALPGIAAKAKEKIKTISNAAVIQTTSKAHVASKAIDLNTAKHPESGSSKAISSTPSPVRSNEKIQKDELKVDHDAKYSSDSDSSSSDDSRSRSTRSNSSASSRSSSSSFSSENSGESSASRSPVARSRSPSIPRRRGSPSFLERRRITSARKRPIPYHRPTPSSASSDSEADEEDINNRKFSPANFPNCANNNINLHLKNN